MHTRFMSRSLTTLGLAAALSLTLGCKSGAQEKDDADVAEGDVATQGEEGKEGKDADAKKMAEADDATEEEATEEDARATVEEDPLASAISNDLRTPEERTRDEHRHPYETLTFFGVEPDDTVLELWAGRGWYTRVLTPYVGPTGKLYVTAYSMDSDKEYRREMTKAVQDYLAKAPSGGDVDVISVATPEVDIDLENQVDVVLTFRNIHNWVAGGYDEDVYKEAYDALKPGGVFGVVEHRGPEGITREESAESGYMDQNAVIADIEAAGFEFVEASEINANPKDTKDHPEGVWTLPPSLRLGDKDRDKYEAIGESDRMTLKFIKPAAAAKDAPSTKEGDVKEKKMKKGAGAKEM